MSIDYLNVVLYAQLSTNKTKQTKNFTLFALIMMIYCVFAIKNKLFIVNIRKIK